jgi:hypothetical protein
VKQLAAFARAHPFVCAWLALGLGMVVVLLLSIRGVGLTPLQTLWAALAAVALAGACVWLVDGAE